jgi:drug/metabolite transporter (DMT)-like permease
MSPILLLILVTGFYAGYNLLIKVSSDFVPAQATTTVLATVCLQVAALAASAGFIVFLHLRGAEVVLKLSPSAYAWAAAAGLCIGAAEIAYFYLFGGLGSGKPMAANLAVPAIVSGTIVITFIVSYFLFREPLTWPQLLGAGLVIAGIATMFLGRASAS